jgi:ribosomal protein S18 acetylase RimI-like enzyme
MNPTILIDRLDDGDLPAALAIQSRAYPPALVESEAVFRNRLELESSFCLAARQGAALVGYLIAYGWRSNSPPALGTVIMSVAECEVLFIHDLAVASMGRRLGIGRMLVEHAFSLAGIAGITASQLVAVDGAAPFWRKLGFRDTAAAASVGEKLASYGVDARWMTRAIPLDCNALH